MFEKMKEIPKFYNCLQETQKEIFSLLFQGPKKRKSKFHNAVLCTVNLENKPEARTVVLRKFCSDQLIINIHSDVRAKKIFELRKNENVTLIFYDDQKKIQLRIRGSAQIEKSKKDSWSMLSNWSRRCYLSEETPGKKIENPSSGFPEKFSFEAPSTDESEDGLKNFSVIKIEISEIEWLYLASQGHRRALFQIYRNNFKKEIKSKWLAP